MCVRKINAQFSCSPRKRNRGHFEGNAVLIVEKVSERMRTALPLLKYSITPKMHAIAGFCIYNLKNFSGGDTSGPSQAPRCLDPDTKSLGSPAFPLFLFYETTTDTEPISIIRFRYIRHVFHVRYASCWFQHNSLAFLTYTRNNGKREKRTTAARCAIFHMVTECDVTIMHVFISQGSVAT